MGRKKRLWRQACQYSPAIKNTQQRRPAKRVNTNTPRNQTDRDSQVPPERMQAFSAAGYVFVEQTDKVTLFRTQSLEREVYLINKNKAITVVVHPGVANPAMKAAGTAACASGNLYHNSNMTRFPKRMRKGKTAVSHGFSIICTTASALAVR